MNKHFPNISNSAPLSLACYNVKKTFSESGLQTEVLSGIHFEVPERARIAIIGPSGSGKSTLLHILGGLDTATEGQVVLLGHNLSTLDESVRSALRNRYLGFVYQFHHLLPEFTVLENVCVPLLIRGESLKKAFIHAKPLLEKAGLLHRMDHKPHELSGGEKQRTAIVRAVITKPHCLLVDEPTGNLDAATAQQVFDMLMALSESSLIVVTHDPLLAKRMDKIFHLENGVLQALKS